MATHMTTTMRHRHRIAKADVVEHVAADLGSDLDGHDGDRAAGQLVGRGLCPERVAEQQDGRAQDRGHQDGQRHVPPVLARSRPQVLRSLTPLLLQAVDGGRDDEDHERQLEVEVDQLQPGLGEEAEALLVDVDAERLADPQRHEAQLAEREDERQGERHAREVRGDTREGDDGRPQPARQAGEDDRVGDEEPEDGAQATAVTRLISMVVRNASTMSGRVRSP